MIIYRQVGFGRLGVFNVKMRAMAMLIHTFLSQAISPCFSNNQYHKALYYWHVLDDRTIPDPGQPPYYSSEFFKIIRFVKENTPLNVAWVTVKQWYQLLLERGITHTSEDPDTPPLLIKSKLEERHPLINFSDSYQMARTFGLTPEQKTFIFKMMQSLLPTRDRLSKIGKVQTSTCTFCHAVPDTTSHLLSCTQSSEVSGPLLHCLASYFPRITPEEIVLLNFPSSESLDLPFAWIISTSLSYIWKERVLGRQAKLDVCKAEMMGKLNLLKSTKWKHFSLHNSAVLLEEMINLHYI